MSVCYVAHVHQDAGDHPGGPVEACRFGPAGQRVEAPQGGLQLLNRERERGGRTESPKGRWTWPATVAVMAALFVLSGAVSVAAATPRWSWPPGWPSDGGRRQGQGQGGTLQFRTTLTSSSVNDAGNGGAANVTALLFSMQTPSGAAAGQGWISCVNILPADQLCHAAFVLADGQIQAQAEIPMAARTFTAAITGGTEAFEGVSGEIVNVRVAPGVVDRTFHLLLRLD